MSVTDALTFWLDSLTTNRILIAYSGGCDSHVLLHALARLVANRRLAGIATELVALHVDHGLDPFSADWARHCGEVTADLGVEFASTRLSALPAGGGPEDRARRGRYRFLAEMMKPGDALVTAHHREDQVETVLFNLFRGAGLQGLSGMPAIRPFAGGFLHRPLLELPQATLIGYAETHELSYLNDPSNQDSRLDRNYIRHDVLPVIASRWPRVADNIRRSAANSADTLAIIERLGRERIVQATVSTEVDRLFQAPVVSVDRLIIDPLEVCLNTLRQWIRDAGFILPSRQRLLRLYEDLATASSPFMRFDLSNGSIRRYRDHLYLMESLPSLHQDSISWTAQGELKLFGGTLYVKARPLSGEGIARRHLVDQLVTVDFKTADRVVRTTPGSPHKSLRKLFQERAVPPWLRPYIPRISIGDTLVSVPFVAENAEFAANNGEDGIRFELARNPSMGACESTPDGLDPD